MVALPLEIIYNIITISLPPSSRHNRDRREFLLPLCHVHSSLRRFVQRLLFSHVILYSRLSIAYFLDAVEGHFEVFDVGSCVQSLELVGWGDEVGGYLLCIIGRCKEIMEMRLSYLVGINFALFSRLGKLRSLICDDVKGFTVEPHIGESSSLASLAHLFIADSHISTPMRATFFTPANLPSLRLFSTNRITFDDGLTYPSPLFATDLHHLDLTRDGLLLLLATRQLRSLTYYVEEGPRFPNDHRFGTPLVAIHLHTYDSWGVDQELLEFGVKSGLIDSGTVVFFPDFAESAAESGWWKTWCLSHGMRAEWSVGELERGWWSEGSVMGEYRDFASWVDKRAESRIAAIQK